MYSAHSTLYSVKYTVYSNHYTVYCKQCTLYSVQYIVYSIQCTLCSVHYTVYTLNRVDACGLAKHFALHHQCNMELAITNLHVLLLENFEVFLDQASARKGWDCQPGDLGPNWPQHREPASYQPEEKLGILVSGPFVLFEDFGPICLVTAVRYRNWGVPKHTV